MNEQLYQIVLARMDRETLPGEVQDAVLAACRGAGDLADLLGSGGSDIAQTSASRPAFGLKGAFLPRLSVQGFRGIGRETVLELQAGTGLTLVS